jgi:hypothetical protein
MIGCCKHNYDEFLLSLHCRETESLWFAGQQVADINAFIAFWYWPALVLEGRPPSRMTCMTSTKTFPSTLTYKALYNRIVCTLDNMIIIVHFSSVQSELALISVAVLASLDQVAANGDVARPVGRPEQVFLPEQIVEVQLRNQTQIIRIAPDPVSATFAVSSGRHKGML